MDKNSLTGDPLDRHHRQPPNVEGTNTNTSTNQQQDIVEIKLTAGSDFEGGAVGKAAQEVTADTYEEVDPTLWFRNIIPLLLLFCKVNQFFIVVFRTYLAINEIMIIFYGRSSQTHIKREKPLR